MKHKFKQSNAWSLHKHQKGGKKKTKSNELDQQKDQQHSISLNQEHAHEEKLKQTTSKNSSSTSINNLEFQKKKKNI